MNSIQEVIVRDAYEWEREAVAAVMLESYQQYAFDLSAERWEEYRDSIRSSAYSDAPHARIVAELCGEIVGSVQLFLSSEALTENRRWGSTRLLSAYLPYLRVPGGEGSPRC